MSFDPSCTASKDFDLFEKYTFVLGSFSMDYYLYDPIAHGADPEQTYPLLTFFHDATSSLNSELCVNYCGGEYFASREYQLKCGGAYILIPMANEVRQENGELSGDWHEDHYIYEVKGLIDKIYAQNSQNINKIIGLGDSSGSDFLSKLAHLYPTLLDELIPVGDDDLPTK